MRTCSKQNKKSTVEVAASRLLQGTLLARSGSLLLLFGISACNTTRSIQSDSLDLQIPEHYSQAQQVNEESLSPSDLYLGDPILPAIIEEGLKNNFSLKAKSYRTEEVRYLYNIARGQQLPSLSLQTGAERRRRTRSAQAASFGQSFGPASSINTSYQFSFNFQWELDLWGKVAKQKKAHELLWSASTHELAAAQLSLSSQIASAWFNANEAQQQMELAQNIVENWQIAHDTVDEKYQQGVESSLNLRIMRSNLASAQSHLALRSDNKTQTIQTLEALIGQYPSSKFQVNGELPSLQPPIRSGLPARLLEKRPDIQAAYKKYLSEEALVDVKKRSLLPSISLTGSTGNASRDLSNLLNSGMPLWNIGSNLLQPIFQGGKLRNDVKKAEVRAKAFQNEFQAIVQQAFLEVEGALSKNQSLKDQLSYMLTAENEAKEAGQSAWENYKKGLVDILTVLESERLHNQSRQQTLSLKNQIIQNRIFLYTALGGSQ